MRIVRLQPAAPATETAFRLLIDAQASQPPGSYSDTVVVTLTY